MARPDRNEQEPAPRGAIAIRALEAGIVRLREEQRRHENGPDWRSSRGSSRSTNTASTCCAERPTKTKTNSSQTRADRRLQKAALEAERRTITQMRGAGEIPDDIFRSIEYDLDLAAIRLS